VRPPRKVGAGRKGRRAGEEVRRVGCTETRQIEFQIMV
jgi:hypothetical protein